MLAHLKLLTLLPIRIQPESTLRPSSSRSTVLDHELEAKLLLVLIHNGFYDGVRLVTLLAFQAPHHQIGGIASGSVKSLRSTAATTTTSSF